MSPPILIEQSGPVLRIIFNRADRLNALTIEMLTRAAEAVEGASNVTGIRAVLVTGAGRAFCSGADLGASSNRPASTIDAANRLTAAVREVPKPVLAAVNGPAVGVGCSFALAV